MAFQFRRWHLWSQGQIKLLPIEQASNPVDKILDMIPGIVDKVNEKINQKKAEKAEKKKPVTVEAVFDD